LRRQESSRNGTKEEDGKGELILILTRNIRVDLAEEPMPKEKVFSYHARQHFRYKNETNQYMLQVSNFFD
jgi:hypothetical protein